MTTMPPPGGGPLVSILMANFNGDRFIEDALASARTQTLQSIEIIVVDDASTDASAETVRRVARQDDRVRLLRRQINGGPAAARNMGLAAAAGRWIAVMDSDDLMHPARLERLLSAAEADGADIAADDMLVFDDAGLAPPTGLLQGARSRRPAWIDTAEYVRSNALYAGRGAALGYLKPVIRAASLRRKNIRYNETLAIAEDFDLILRLLLNGARMRSYPELTYFYRRHGASISHRLSRPRIEPMLVAQDALWPPETKGDTELAAAFRTRRRSLERALAFEDILDRLKTQRPDDALRHALRSPGGALLLRIVLRDRLRRLFTRRPRQRQEEVRTAGGVSVCLVSRQRLIGAVSGSSAYLLGLRDALVARGCAVHLVCPSPAAFGRWPVLPLRPEMAGFASIAMRGGWKLGNMLVARDPRVHLKAAAAVLDAGLRRFGLGLGRLAARAPYAVALPWCREDQLFVAAHAPRLADAVLVDYCFLTDAIPYALRPRSASAVVMHELFSSRTEQFRRLGAEDSVATIPQDAEMAMLGRAGAVIAIQAEEGRLVRQALPGRQVILAPMAATTVPAPQPGTGNTLLFVGSNTAPNLQALRWFAEAIWPRIRAAVPSARLSVAGTVCHAIGPVPAGFWLLGLVPDLAPLYADAAVVVSPLRTGSGLKVKLVEALAQGKAIVATTFTVQGVEAAVTPAVAVCNEAPDFAAEVIGLLGDDARRLARCEAALAVAHAHFSAAACYGAFADFLAGPREGVAAG